MLWSSIIPGLFTLLLSASVAAFAGTVDSSKADDTSLIDTIVHKAGYDSPDAPGLSVIVIRDGKILTKKAYGLADVEAKTLNTTRTNFRLASVTKQFTAMAILILIKQGKLRLDSRLTDFFPEFPAYGKDITIRQVLNHTSGLPDYAAHIPAGQKEQLKDADVLRILENQASGNFLPGTKYEYSNSGYVVLGLIVAKVSGRTFAQFLTENIFQPLGMTDTVAYEQGISIVKNRAFGYSPTAGGFERTDQSITSATLGDGGIYTSVEDMYRWDQALYTAKLVSADMLKMAFTPGEYGNGEKSDYGFGWSIASVQGFRQLSHGGGTIGFRTHILRMPDQKYTVVVLMNRSDGNPQGIASKIALAHFPALTVPEPPIAKVSATVLERCVGHYDARGGVSTITMRDGKLFWAGMSSRPLELLPLSEDTFFYADADINPERNWRLTFIKDAQGRITQFTYHADGRTVFTAVYMGPLIHTLPVQADPEPALIPKVEAVLKAMADGKAAEEVRYLTPGARKDFGDNRFSSVAGLRSLSFRATQDVSAKGIERHGGKVSRIVTYKMETDTATRYVLIYMTPEGLITDEDVVDD